jgi:hypothetical protein
MVSTESFCVRCVVVGKLDETVLGATRAMVGGSAGREKDGRRRDRIERCLWEELF